MVLQAGQAPVRKVSFPSGHKYAGQISNGTMNGLGVYAFDSTQARYEGEVLHTTSSYAHSTKAVFRMLELLGYSMERCGWHGRISGS